MEKIEFTHDEFCKLKEIGHGTDGCVFKYKRNLLIKIYHKRLIALNEENNILTKNEKIYDNEKIPFKANDTSTGINYYTGDGINKIVKIEDNLKALEMAIDIQKNIKRTTLPLGAVFYKDNNVGLIIKKLNGTQIHKLSGMPYKYKYEIIKSLLLDVEELLKNNIYHVDLANSPFAISSYYRDKDNITRPLYGHSHVLVNPITKKTNIIDLDGKSTIYMDYNNEEYEQKCVSNLCTLLREFLYQINPEEINDEDEESIVFELSKYGVNNYFAQKLAKEDFENFKEFKYLLKKEL